MLYILLALLNLNKLHSITNIPFKVFCVIRNPFDNIATIALYEHIRFQDNKIAVIKSINETLRLNPEHIYSAMNYFFLRYQAAEDIKRRFNFNTMETIHNKDLIANPKSKLSILGLRSLSVFIMLKNLLISYSFPNLQILPIVLPSHRLLFLFLFH